MMLNVQGLRTGYGRIPILNGVSFTVNEGEFIGILGHNGMGKTTLLKALMGFLPATGGLVRLGGETVRASDIRLMRRIRRDLEQRGRTFAQVRKQYYESVRPMHLAFVEPSKRFADLIVPEGGQNRVALDLILSHVNSRV